MDAIITNTGYTPIKLHLLEYLDPKTLANCRLVNRAWCESISDSRRWSISMLEWLETTFKDGLNGQDAQAKWNIWEPIVNKAKRTEKKEDLRKLAFFLRDILKHEYVEPNHRQLWLGFRGFEKQFLLTREPTLKCSSALFGIEKLLLSGDNNQFAKKILAWMDSEFFPSDNPVKPLAFDGYYTCMGKTSDWALLFACMIGLLETVKYLLTDPLQQGVDLNFRLDGCPMIIYAARHVSWNNQWERELTSKKVEIFRVLIKDPRLNINAISDVFNLGNHLPQSMRLCGRWGLLRELALNEDIETMALVLTETGIDVNQQCYRGRTALLMIIQEYHFTKSLGYRGDRQNPKFVRPLPLLSVHDTRQLLLALLMSHPNIDVNIADGEGWTPLHYAAHHGDPRAISMLLQVEGIDVHATNFDDNTAADLNRRALQHKVDICFFDYQFGDLLAVRKLLADAIKYEEMELD